MKKVYIVTGSEDGIIGVYSNKKLALQNALNYLGEEPDFYPYSKFTKEFDSWATIENESGTSASIDMRYMNINLSFNI